MSELREQLEQAATAYRSARYPGDLGEVVLRGEQALREVSRATPPRPHRRRRRLGWAIAIASSGLVAIGLLPNDPTAPPAVKASRATARTLLTSRVTPPPILKRLNQAPTLTTALPARRRSVRRWASPLAFARPRPSIVVATATVDPTSVDPTMVGPADRAATANATATRPRPSREASLSPSIRSLNDAISLAG